MWRPGSTGLAAGSSASCVVQGPWDLEALHLSGVSLMGCCFLVFSLFRPRTCTDVGHAHFPFPPIRTGPGLPRGAGLSKLFMTGRY